MNELELIQTLKERLLTNEGVIVGPGDDCAVLRAPDKGCYLLLKQTVLWKGYISYLQPIHTRLVGKPLPDVSVILRQWVVYPPLL